MEVIIPIVTYVFIVYMYIRFLFFFLYYCVLSGPHLKTAIIAE